jgi:hypothetical protein
MINVLDLPTFRFSIEAGSLSVMLWTFTLGLVFGGDTRIQMPTGLIRVFSIGTT